MRALVVFGHPSHASFNGAVLALVLAKLRVAGAEVRLHDPYAEGFQPILTPEEWHAYPREALKAGQPPHPDQARLEASVAQQVADVKWCDTMIFVYPTWWFGLPAMLKGWLDRVFLPGVSFLMPDAENPKPRPGLTHVKRFGVFTTCGATWLHSQVVGMPGARTLIRGIGLNAGWGTWWRSVFAAHYLMDSSTPESRQKHLRVVAEKMDRLIGRHIAVALPEAPLPPTPAAAPSPAE